MSQIYTDETPADVKNAKGLHLLTQSTPNGQKVQILLEELAAAYGLDFSTTLINIFSNEQKKDWFLRLNPNGKIPVIVDNTSSKPVPVFESSAELLYLVEKYDKEHRFGFTTPEEQSQLLQWLFFFHGGGGPIQGQFTFFNKFAKEKVPLAIDRFRTEILRVYDVLEIQLAGRITGQAKQYLVGNGKGKYSIADIAIYPWVAKYDFSGLTREDLDKFPHLLQWVERIGERAAVKTGTGDKYQPKK